MKKGLIRGNYETETKVLKQQVKRNLERFPQDFMFELTKPSQAFKCVSNGIY